MPEIKDNTFVVNLENPAILGGHILLKGDTIFCRKITEPLPGMILILDSDLEGTWPVQFECAAAELEAGARIVGQAMSLFRDLDRGVRRADD